MEQWKDIKGYEGLYSISSYGRVWSYWKKDFKCPHPDKDGYLIIGLSKDHKLKKVKLHRLVAEAFIPNPDNLPCINHKDENKANNNVNNLEWCTVSYNNTYGTRIERAMETLRNRNLKK